MLSGTGGHLGCIYTKEAGVGGWGYRSEGRVASSQTMPCTVSRFDTHSRWPPLMKSARSRQSYGKIGYHEQSKTFVLIT